MKRASLIVFFSAAAAVAAAQDDRGFYVGGNAGVVEFHGDSVFDSDVSDARFRVLELVGGYKFNNALGGEVRVGAGLGERDTEVSGVAHELKIDRYESIYYRPELTNEEAKLYALLGYTRVKRSDSTATGDTSDSESGTSYGIGVGWVVDPRSNFNIEFRRLIDKDDYEIDAITVGFDYRF